MSNQDESIFTLLLESVGDEIKVQHSRGGEDYGPIITIKVLKVDEGQKT